MAYKRKSPIPEDEGGTNQTSYTTGDILYASGADTLSKLAVGSNDEVLTLAAGVPSWAAASGGATTREVPIFDNDGTHIGGPLIVDTNTLASVGVTDQRLYLLPLNIPIDCTLDRLLARVATGVAGATFRVGLYDQVGGIPTNLIAESGVLSAATSSTIVESAALSTSLTAGFYWGAITVDENAGAVSISGVGSYKNPGWYGISGSSITIRNYYLKDSIDPASSLPDPLSGLSESTSNLLPTVFYKISL